MRDTRRNITEFIVVGGVLESEDMMRDVGDGKLGANRLGNRQIDTRRPTRCGNRGEHMRAHICM